METVLQTSSESGTRTKEIRVNHDRTTTYIDHYEHGVLVAHFTMKRSDWDLFILAEYASRKR